MSRRLKVLMSAYACEPGKGSEPEVGWQWALQMARFHDVVVLTRANNRGSIEAGLAPLRGQLPLPEFVYHDESPFLLGIKKYFGATKLYYLLWQRSARELLVRLQESRQFDLFHHVTFAAFRYPAAIWGHRRACVWGPIGGIESVPFSLLPWSHPRSLIHEIVRGTHNLLQASPLHILPKRARATTVILASTPEMQRAFGKHGFEARLMPTIGLSPFALPVAARAPRQGPLRLLYVGNIITLKGIDLAIEALQQSQCDATLTLIGEGNFLPAVRKLARKLGLAERVSFRGRLPREEVLKLYSQFDVFVFPSMHDTGGYALIEAMFNGLPVVCLDVGGPAVAVGERCGVKVPLGARAAVVAGLASAIGRYSREPAVVAAHGENARHVILEKYDWNKKGEQMNLVYEQAMGAIAHKEPQSSTGPPFTGIGGTTRMLHGVISLRGMTAGMLAFVLIAVICFRSLSHLKHQADLIVNDTLPGLASVGAADSHLADASRTLLYIITDDPARRSQLLVQMENLSRRTTSYLEQYRASIFSEVDSSNFTALVAMRRDYIQIRDLVIELAAAGKKDEALKTYENALVPKQALVKQAGDKLLAFNMEEAKSRGKDIMFSCTATQVTVVVIGLAVFVLGYLLGLFK